MEKAFSQAPEKASKTNTAGIAMAKPGGTPVKGITEGRAKALVGTVVGLTSLLVGWRAKLLSKRSTGGGRTAAITALVLGLTCITLSVIHLSTSYVAALGSGSGKAGAFVALLLGIIGMVLGGLVMRLRKE